MKNKIQLIKYIVSLMLIFFIIKNIDISAIYFLLINANLNIYYVVILLYLSGIFMKSIRWKFFLLTQKITNISIFSLFKLNMIGLVWNSILPTNIGGDAVRIYKVMQKNPEIKHRVVISTVTDRVVSISALFSLLLLSLPFNGFIDEKVRLMFFMVFISTMILVFVFFRMDYSDVLIRRFFEIIGQKKWYSMFEESKSKLYANPRILFFGFIFSMFIHIVSIFNNYLMFKVIGVSVPFIFLFSVILFVNVILLIPVSLGGIGLREMSFIIILSVVGVSSSQVVSYSILGYCNILFLIVVQIVFLIFGSIKRYYYEYKSV